MSQPETAAELEPTPTFSSLFMDQMVTVARDHSMVRRKKFARFFLTWILGSGNNFERGKTDSFGFQAVDLGDLTKIRIGHDGSNFGSDWFLEKVVITNKESTKKWYFLHGRWLGKGEDDGSLEREIAASSEDGKVNFFCILIRRIFSYCEKF
jgi:hypothetical protein